METSRWIEEVVHPGTGEKRLFQADTEEQLEQQIAAWKAAGDPDAASRRETVDTASARLRD